MTIPVSRDNSLSVDTPRFRFRFGLVPKLHVIFQVALAIA
jgi:hypothetical protein